MAAETGFRFFNLVDLKQGPLELCAIPGMRKGAFNDSIGQLELRHRQLLKDIVWTVTYRFKRPEAILVLALGVEACPDLAREREPHSLSNIALRHAPPSSSAVHPLAV